MKRMGIVGLCLAAVFAFTAVSASAFTPPEFFTCKKLTAKPYTGKFVDKACKTSASPAEITEAKKNKYERAAWNEGKEPTPKYKAKNEGAPKNFQDDVLTAKESAASVQPGFTECQKEKLAGEVTGPKTEKWTTHYSKCIAEGTPCKSSEPAAKKGEIITQTLEGTLVFLNTEKTKVGVRVKGLGPEGSEKNGGLLAQYECEVGVNVHVYGEVIAGPMENNIEEAVKGNKTSIGEGPLLLQKYSSVENTISEEDTKNFFEWASNAPEGTELGDRETGTPDKAEFEACIGTELGKGHSLEEAEFLCFLAGKAWESFPNQPIMLLSHLNGAAVEKVVHLKEVTVPASQNGVTLAKGEPLGVRLGTEK